MTTTKTRRRGWGQFTAGMVFYAVLVTVTSLTVDRFDLARPYLIVLALAPMIPAVWAMLGWLRAVRSLDELQQRIVGEGVYWSLGLTAALTFSYGFLEAYADFSHLSMFVVWPIICVTYVFGQALARRRYR